MTDLLELLCAGIKFEDEDLKKVLEGVDKFIKQEGDTNKDRIVGLLIFRAIVDMKDKNIVKEFIKVAEYLDIIDKLFSAETLQSCFIEDNFEFIEALLDTEDHKFVAAGNIVRKAIYANKLKIAEVFINHGYKAPKVITMYNISNHLGWDSERIKFLINNGTKIELNCKELCALNIISNNININCIYTKEAMLYIIKSDIGTKMSHPLLSPSSYFVYNEENKTIYYVDDCNLLGSHNINNDANFINVMISDKKYNSGWYIYE